MIFSSSVVRTWLGAWPQLAARSLWFPHFSNPLSFLVASIVVIIVVNMDCQDGVQLDNFIW